MITVSDLGLSFSGQNLFSHVNLLFTAGNCYGVIGANGAGKSTFLKILSGELEPTKGEVIIDPKLRMSVLKQDHHAYDAYTVFETILMGNPRLYEVLKQKDALYAKEDFSDADGDLALEPIEELGSPLLVPGEGVSIQVPPLFHAQGISSVAMFVLGGITTVLTGRFRPDTFLDLCDRWQAQYTSGNPPMYLALAAHSAQTGRQATTVRAALSGAAPLDATSLSKIATVMPNAVVGEGYGLTEGTCIVTASDLTPSGVRRAGTVGVPIPDTEVEIRSADGAQVLPAGTEGELWVRGPQVTDGYHGAPELTAAQYVDGWLRTGDVASVDAEGLIRIHDRAKDMLLYKGYNVYPRELEDIVTAHPCVAQAAVVGRPDADVGEIPVAFIVPRPAPEAAEAAAAGNAEASGQSDSGQSDSAAQDEALVAEIMDWFAQQVLPYQKIREVHLVDALPTSTAGKVLKTELRTRL